MTSDRGRPPRKKPSRLAEAARAASGGAALTAVVSFLGTFFGQRSIAIEGAQAVLVEWGATQLGAVWSDPAATAPSRKTVAERALQGGAIGLAAGGFVLAFARATGAVASMTPLLSAVGVGLAFVQASLLAVRDELLVHGIVLGLLRGRPFSVRLLAGAAASAAWAFGVAAGDGRDAIALSMLVVEALAGAAFSALWLRERGAWRACGAHAGWLFATRGAVLVRATSSAWGSGGDGTNELLSGWAAAAALVPVCVALILWAPATAARQETSAPPPAVG